MEDEKLIDQSVLAEDVASQIKYQFLDFFLVKPLDPVKVKKEFSKPVPTGTPAKDENGIEAQDFDRVETEVKEVDSDYRRGVVLKRPLYYVDSEKNDNVYTNINVGDVVIFRDAAGLRFDLLKDSRLLRQYDILGIEK
ncbi:MAG: hypothetical protein VZR53_00665 [Prevotella sp.]|nr:hypothetical protein [Prevotella sp.]